MDFIIKVIAVVVYMFTIFILHKYFIRLSSLGEHPDPLKLSDNINKMDHQTDSQSENNISEHSSISFTLASYYSNHMVLQKEPYSAILWGLCNKDGTVVAQLDQSATTYSGQIEEHSENKHIWSIRLPPQPPGGPHNIYITYTSENNAVKKLGLSDVLFGEVWFCSGQSNMHFYLQWMRNASKLLSEAQNYKNIRYYQTMLQRSSKPNINLEVVRDAWLMANDGHGTSRHFSALCWLFGKQLYDHLQVPIGLVHSSYSGTTIEEWSSYETLQICNATNMDDKIEGRWKEALSYLSNEVRSSLWNAMVHPFLRMVIRGVIWYQGEYNAGFHQNQYNCSFPSLIRSWRQEWNKATKGSTDEQFPFGFVQLAGFGRGSNTLWTWLRWHQTADTGFSPNKKMNNTFMAVSADLPDPTDPNDIHPREKTTIAYRLSWAALNQVYGKTNFPTNGPITTEASIKYEDTGFIVLTYDQPILMKKKTGFKYCCGKPSEMCSTDPDAKEWKGVIKIHQDNSTTIRLEVSCKPSELLYAWSALPCLYKQCSIYANDSYRLPAAPWRWKL